MAMSLVTAIFSKDLFLGVFIKIANSTIGTNIPEFQASLSDKLLAAIVVIFVIYVGLRLHENWPGETSTREARANDIGVKPSVVSGTVAAVGDLLGYSPLVASGAASPKSAATTIFPMHPVKTWPSLALQMTQIKFNQLHVSEATDWYADRQAFIGRYGGGDRAFGLLCVGDAPSNTTIESLRV